MAGMIGIFAEYQVRIRRYLASAWQIAVHMVNGDLVRVVVDRFGKDRLVRDRVGRQVFLNQSVEVKCDDGVEWTAIALWARKLNDALDEPRTNRFSDV